MKTSKYLVLILFTGSFIFACERDKVNVQKYLEYSIAELCGPDSILTKEQKQTKHQLVETIAANLIVEGDKVIFSMNKDEFLSKGLPESYYDLLLREINTLNQSLSQDTVMRRTILKDLPVQMAKMHEQNTIID